MSGTVSGPCSASCLLGSPLNTMVGEGAVSAVSSFSLGHMASDAVACLVRMVAREGCLRVTEHAALTIVRNRFGRLVVRIVAGATPHLSAAAACAFAQRELLGVTYYLEGGLGAGWRFIVIDGEGFFERLSRGEVGEFFAGIKDARHADEMTLLAYAVACGWLQIGRIDDVSRHRFCEVRGERSVASIAADREMGKWDGCVSVLRSFDCVERSGVAEHTAGRDGASEVRIWFAFVAGRQSIG